MGEDGEAARRVRQVLGPAEVDGPEPEAAPVPPRGGVSRRAVVVAALLALLVAGVAVPRAVLAGGDEPEPLPVRPVAAVSSPSTVPAAVPSPSPTPAATVLVHVVGQVRRPGVVRLPAGARVADAVRAAGGATRRADLAGVNLARPVADGEQLVVPRPGDATPAAPGGPAAGAGPGTGGGSAPAASVDLNNATESQLDALPGVGPVIAGRIVAWRQEHGRFTSVDELTEVSGIGDATLTRLRPLVRV